MKAALSFLSLMLCLSVPITGAAQTQPLVVNYAAINANILNLWIGKEGGHFAEEVDWQLRILPDLPYAPEEGMKTILEDLARTLPDARRLQPAALIDTTVVRDAAK